MSKKLSFINYIYQNYLINDDEVFYQQKKIWYEFYKLLSNDSIKFIENEIMQFVKKCEGKKLYFYALENKFIFSTMPIDSKEWPCDDMEIYIYNNSFEIVYTHTYKDGRCPSHKIGEGKIRYLKRFQTISKEILKNIHEIKIKRRDEELEKCFKKEKELYHEETCQNKRIMNDLMVYLQNTDQFKNNQVCNFIHRLANFNENELLTLTYSEKENSPYHGETYPFHLQVSDYFHHVWRRWNYKLVSNKKCLIFSYKWKSSSFGGYPEYYSKSINFIRKSKTSEKVFVRICDNTMYEQLFHGVNRSATVFNIPIEWDEKLPIINLESEIGQELSKEVLSKSMLEGTC